MWSCHLKGFLNSRLVPWLCHADKAQRSRSIYHWLPITRWNGYAHAWCVGHTGFVFVCSPCLKLLLASNQRLVSVGVERVFLLSSVFLLTSVPQVNFLWEKNPEGMQFAFSDLTLRPLVFWDDFHKNWKESLTPFFSFTVLPPQVPLVNNASTSWHGCGDDSMNKLEMRTGSVHLESTYHPRRKTCQVTNLLLTSYMTLSRKCEA